MTFSVNHDSKRPSETPLEDPTSTKRQCTTFWSSNDLEYIKDLEKDILNLEWSPYSIESLDKLELIEGRLTFLDLIYPEDSKIQELQERASFLKGCISCSLFTESDSLDSPFGLPLFPNLEKLDDSDKKSVDNHTPLSSSGPTSDPISPLRSGGPSSEEDLTYLKSREFKQLQSKDGYFKTPSIINTSSTQSKPSSFSSSSYRKFPVKATSTGPSNSEQRRSSYLSQIEGRIKEGLVSHSVTISVDFSRSIQPYQQTALKWLQFLSTNNQGGILISDLSKETACQVLVHLQSEKDKGRLSKPALIVVNAKQDLKPWSDKITQHTNLKLHIHQEVRSSLKKCDIVLTTSHCSTNNPMLPKHEYSTLIVDSAETLKNATTQKSQILCQYKADSKLCIIDYAPIKIREIWSFFHFLNPKLLGSYQDLTQISERLYVFEKNKFAHQIRNLLAPFILKSSKKMD